VGGHNFRDPHIELLEKVVNFGKTGSPGMAWIFDKGPED
jgi:hypothetical protein